MIAPRLHDGHRHAAIVILGGIGLEGFGNDHHGRVRAERGVKADLPGSARDMEPHIRFVEPVYLERFVKNGADLVNGHREREENGVPGMLEARQMPFEQKNPAVIGAYGFIDAVTIEKAMVKDRDRGLFFRHKSTVEIHEHGWKVSLS